MPSPLSTVMPAWMPAGAISDMALVMVTPIASRVENDHFAAGVRLRDRASEAAAGLTKRAEIGVVAGRCDERSLSGRCSLEG